jgi:hypothetical protein
VQGRKGRKSTADKADKKEINRDGRMNGDKKKIRNRFLFIPVHLVIPVNSSLCVFASSRLCVKIHI